MFVLGLAHFVFCDETNGNVVAFVRAKIDNCLAVLPSGDRGHPRYMREFGIPGELYVPEAELGIAILDAVDDVLHGYEHRP